MTEAETRSGGCQCGAVRYRTTIVHANAHLCHCRMCQKAVGNVFAALVGAPNDALTFTRGAPSLFRSSKDVERGFCSRCGTPLFVRTIGAARTHLTIGSLDDPNEVPALANEGTEAMVSWFAGIPDLKDNGATEDEDPGWAAAIKASNRQHPDHDTETWPRREEN